MAAKLEDILFLNPIDSTQDHEDLKSLLDDYDQHRSSNRYRKLMSAFNSFKKHPKITDEVEEQMIVEELKAKCYPGYVKFFKSNYDESLKNSMKCIDKSVEARVKASKLFAKGNHDVHIHEEIWRLYSRSIAFAPTGSKELILAYECRSNFLLHLKNYKDCIKDIDRALAITKFNLLKVKLLCRKMTCYVGINKNTDEKKDLWSSIKFEFGKLDDALKDEKFLKIVKQARRDKKHFSDPSKEDNLEGSSMSLMTFPNIALTYDKDIGVVANRDFVAGEEVVVTKPLVTSVNPDKCYAYCSHCLSFMWSGIPCDKCSLCMYCSEECKTQAWDKYHVLECKILPHINFDNLIYFNLQATIRMFMVGLREFGSVSKLKEEIDKLKDNPKLMEPDKLLDSDFLNFYVTPTRRDNYDKELLSIYAKHACFLVAYIIQTSDIFEENIKLLKGKELAKDENIVFCGLLLFKMLVSCSNNMQYNHKVYATRSKCTQENSDVNKKVDRSCRMGKFFHPFQGMFEKSCNPNVAKFWTDDGKIIYLCVQPIKKLEKINYSCCEFYHVKKDDRMEYGWNDAEENCKCDACEKDWPTLDELVRKFLQRRHKSDKKEIKIVEAYMHAHHAEITEGNLAVGNCFPANESEFKEFAKDVNDVVKVCGQPSFASSYLMARLCSSYQNLKGTVPLKSHIPTGC